MGSDHYSIIRLEIMIHTANTKYEKRKKTTKEKIRSYKLKEKQITTEYQRKIKGKF